MEKVARPGFYQSGSSWPDDKPLRLLNCKISSSPLGVLHL